MMVRWRSEKTLFFQNYYPIHETPLGWNENNEFEHLFPYGVEIADTSTKSAAKEVDDEGASDSGDGDNQANEDESIAATQAAIKSLGDIER